MSIVEFLRARIAEDQREADSILDTLVDDRFDYEAFERGQRLDREAEAKRAILEQADAHSDAEFPDFAGGYRSAMEDVLQILAAVYADHPDHRREWRP